MNDPWKETRVLFDGLRAPVVVRDDPVRAAKHLRELLADADALQQALYDIAHGMVPREFLTDIENETKESFQTRLATWSQKRAKEALANLKGE